MGPWPPRRRQQRLCLFLRARRSAAGIYRRGDADRPHLSAALVGLLEIPAQPLRSVGCHATALGALLSRPAAVRLHRRRRPPRLNANTGRTSVRRSFIVSIATLLALATAPLSAVAQETWPTRPIRALTTASPGGISDVFMRALGEKLGEKLGKPIVVENRPGGMQN